MGCKNCGCASEPEQQLQLAIDGPIVALARFPSLAECGFFADELTAATDVATETRTQDEFDPLSNNWAASYVLCVHEKDAEQAMGFLSQRKAAELLPGEDEEEDFSTQSASQIRNQNGSATEDFESRTSGGWLIPLLLTAAVAAGGLWLYQDQMLETNADGLVTELKRFENQWEQANSTGRVVRRMKFDPVTSVVKITEDAEGDGEFERSREFTLTK